MTGAAQRSSSFLYLLVLYIGFVELSGGQLIQTCRKLNITNATQFILFVKFVTFNLLTNDICTYNEINLSIK